MTSAAIASHYAHIIDGLLVDERDGAAGVDAATAPSDMLIVSLEDRIRVVAALVFVDEFGAVQSSTAR